MTHGKSPRSGSSKTPSHQGHDGRENQGTPSRPFSLPPGYYDHYGIPRPEPAPGAVQAKRPGFHQGPPIPRGLLEYHGILPRAIPDSASAQLQQKADGASARSEADPIHEAAAHGTSGPSGPLPYIDPIQKAFGRHDVQHIQAHTDGRAAAGSRAMGAEAFTVGEHVAFAGAPSLHTAAHEAAHVVQQRAGVQLKGGVGEVGDRYEQHADRVADRVAQGQSAEPLLDEYAGASATAGHTLQRKLVPGRTDGEFQDSRCNKVFVRLEEGRYREKTGGEVFTYDAATFQYRDADGRYYDPCTGQRFQGATDGYLTLDGRERYYYKNGHYWPDLTFRPPEGSASGRTLGSDDRRGPEQETTKSDERATGGSVTPITEPPLYAPTVDLLTALGRSLLRLKEQLSEPPDPLRAAVCRRHLRECLEKLPRGVAYAEGTRLGHADLERYRELCAAIAETWQGIDGRLGESLSRGAHTFAGWHNPDDAPSKETHSATAEHVPALEPGQVHLDLFGEGRHGGAINVGNTEKTTTTGGSGRRVPSLVFRNFSPRDAAQNQLPIADGAVDLVTAENGPIHFPGVIAELARITRAGGTIVLFGPSDLADVHEALAKLVNAAEVLRRESGSDEEGGMVRETVIKVPGR
ncbi:MAG TPA: DUF4157 domain-containing protein [Polyangia bacterium]|jgi:hypothetical protein|nr:DUF4157 domain-containing protein [Polyangia bacterium]